MIKINVTGKANTGKTAISIVIKNILSEMNIANIAVNDTETTFKVETKEEYKAFIEDYKIFISNKKTNVYSLFNSSMNGMETSNALEADNAITIDYITDTATVSDIIALIWLVEQTLTNLGAFCYLNYSRIPEDIILNTSVFDSVEINVFQKSLIE